MPQTIDSMIRWWAEETPEVDALVQDGQRVTFAQINEWAGKVAARFADAGLEIGDRVCIHAANSIAWAVAGIATLRCGGVIAGLAPKLVEDEVAYLVGDYAPRLLVVDDETAGVLPTDTSLQDRNGVPTAAPTRFRLSEIAAMRDAPPAPDIRREVDPDALALIVTTSGSTARPKGVMFSNHTLIDHVSAFRFEERTDAIVIKMLIVAPFSTTAGGMVLLHSLMQGGTGYIMPRFEPAKALDLVVEERLTVFCAAPLFLQRVAEDPRFPHADVSSIQVSFTGGAAVAPELLKAWADKGVIVRQMFGQSEAGGWGTTNPARYAISDPDRCGHGGPLRDIGIIDENGNFLGPNQQGQIVMRGPGTMIGYWNDPEATAKTLVDGWLRTGDIGEIDERGLLRFVDRMKDIIISGGLNISAAEVERVLVDHPAIEEAAVIKVADDKFGETPGAIVYAPDSLEIEQLVTYCNDKLSSHKVPRYIVLHEGPLPRLATGKIAKPALRERYAEPGSMGPKVR